MRKLNWSEIRDEYVTGSESCPALAKRLRIPVKTLLTHAHTRAWNDGKTWGELRKEFRAESSRRFQESQIETRAQIGAEVAARHARDLKRLYDAVVEQAIGRIGELDGATQVKALLDVMAAERKAFGLEKAPAAGTVDDPVFVAAQFGQLTIAELRALAGEAEHDRTAAARLDTGASKARARKA